VSLQGISQSQQRPAQAMELFDQIENHTHAGIVDAHLVLKIATKMRSRNIDTDIS
jgi:hypothetical protein